MQHLPANPIDYHNAAVASNLSHGARGKCMTIPTEADHYFISPDTYSGFALQAGSHMGYLVGVFCHAEAPDKPRLGKIVEEAGDYLAALGCKYMELDCYMPLVSLYMKQGFTPVDEVFWDDEYAPNDWPYEQLGRPNIAILRKTLHGVRKEAA